MTDFFRLGGKAILPAINSPAPFQNNTGKRRKRLPVLLFCPASVQWLLSRQNDFFIKKNVLYVKLFVFDLSAGVPCRK
jgi:hypothetical protein